MSDMDRQRACIVLRDAAYTAERSQITITEPAKGRWKSGIVTYRLVNNSGDIPGDKLESVAVSGAFLEWGRHIRDIRFKRVTKDTEVVDIKIKFDSNDPYFTGDGILAYAWYPNLSDNRAGDIVFNDSTTLRWSLDGISKSSGEAYLLGWIDLETHEKFPNNRYKTINLRQVVTHEIGHALGLAHNTECKECILYPYYHNSIFLAKNDIERIQAIYGKRNLNQSIFNSLRRILSRIIS